MTQATPDAYIITPRRKTQIILKTLIRNLDSSSKKCKDSSLKTVSLIIRHNLTHHLTKDNNSICHSIHLRACDLMGTKYNKQPFKHLLIHSLKYNTHRRSKPKKTKRETNLMVISKKSKPNLRASRLRSLRISAKIMRGYTLQTKMTSIMLHILISDNHTHTQRPLQKSLLLVTEGRSSSLLFFASCN